MRPIVFRRQARRELDEAGDWYEQERSGLGLEFFAEIERLLHCITGSCAGGKFSKLHIQSGYYCKIRIENGAPS